MSHIDTIQGAERLMQALLALHTREECHAFLEDICTIKEVQDISQRIEVAFMLDEGKNYQEIAILLEKPAKSIDNALQRIKKKIMTLIEK